jgi:hypothetical protein
MAMFRSAAAIAATIKARNVTSLKNKNEGISEHFF